MKKLNINLNYCHGISKLEYTFDFSDKDYLIYAPNGTMKTSLYKTFEDYIKGIEPEDKFYHDRKSMREISIDNHEILETNKILLVGNREYDLSADNVSSLLVNSELKKKYDSIMSNLTKKLKEIEKKLKEFSGEKLDSLFQDLNISKIQDIPKTLFDKNNTIDKFNSIKYKEIFNKDYIENYSDKQLINYVEDYLDVCNSIIKSNCIFVKDIFELHNLQNVVKSLDSNNYFEANHELNLIVDRQNKKYESFNRDLIDKLIKDTEEKMNKSEIITKINNKLTSKIKSIELRKFISQNNWIIPYLNNISNLKKLYWNYIISYNDDLSNLISIYIKEYESNKTEIKGIIKLAESEENKKQWNEAIGIFNSKFIDMPFSLNIDNVRDIILQQKTCSISYKYHDNKNDDADVELHVLKENLSNGELRAFNILNLIFEIQARTKNNQETLIVIDDIADSFDYKNKYAIVEFLKEINDNKLFHIIILSHNYDFYRITANQLNVTTLSVIKNDKINLVDFHYYKRNIFEYFKENIEKPVFYISSIPFMRNIIELTKGEEDDDYKKLTSCLHYKDDTDNIYVETVNTIIKKLLGKDITIENKKYFNLLFETSDSIKESTKIELENKICLSIAIRVKYEKYLTKKLKKHGIKVDFSSNQMGKIIKTCKEKRILDNKEKELADKVSIMTSDNIHLNAFMFEPIIDMGDAELLNLYGEIKKISIEQE